MASMAEVPAGALMPVAEKTADAPATASAKKASSKEKKRKGKGSSDPAAEAPVAKKPRPSDTLTSAVEPPGSSGLVTAATAHTVAPLPAPRLTLSLPQDASADGQRLQQPSKSNGKRHNSSATKRFKPPMARKFNSPMARSPMVTRSPMMRLLVSLVVVQLKSPALAPQRSPSRSPLRSPSRSPRRSSAVSPHRSPARSPRTAPAGSPASLNLGKPRKLRSTIWKDMDAIYQDGKLIQARCKHCYEQAFGVIECGYHLDKVDEVIRRLFNAYSTQMGGSSQVETHGDDVTPTDKSHSWSDWRAHTSAKTQVNNEYERYLYDDLFPCDEESFDILNWWKMHAFKYPILAAMARDVLAVTASTVPSESAFSISGRVINDHRTRLAGSTVEALLCYQDWLQAAGSYYLDIITIDSLSENSEAMMEW